MNKPEFLSEYTRLCKGFRFESTPEQSAAWYSRIGHLPVEDWREAVTTLLCNPRFPTLDPAMVACEQAGEHRRRMTAQKERMEAQQFFRGKVVYRKGDDPIEQAYNAFRMKLLLAAYEPGRSPREYAKRCAEGLAGWISVRAHAEWARNTPMGECGQHFTPHSVLRCISDELQFWTAQAAGQSEDQRCGICSGKDHEPGECWHWLDEKERQRRFQLPYWQERMRTNGIDPKTVVRPVKSAEPVVNV